MEQKELTVQEAVAYLHQYRETTGKTQTAIARELDISSGALSSFLAGSYKAPHTITPRVIELMALNEKKQVAPKEPDYVETTVSRTVTNAIKYAHIQGKIAVVYGDAGVGKTMAAKEYLKRNGLAIGITINPTYASITGVNELLAEQLGVRERVSRKITAEIVTKLRGSGRVIVVDEAQHLTVRTLNHLRCMSDESGIGITLIGNDEVYTKMKGSGRADFAQLFSRVGMRKQVLTSSITQEDVRLIFGQYDVSPDSLEMLYRICRTNYGLRGAVNVYVNTAAVFADLSAGNVGRVMKDMNIGA